MDPRDNRGKAKQTSEESSRQSMLSGVNRITGNFVATNNYNRALAQFASSQHQNVRTTPSLSNMQFVQQYQRPSFVGNTNFIPYMTAPPAYNYMQYRPNYSVYGNNISPDVGGRGNYQQQSFNNSESLVHLTGTSMNTEARGPLVQSIIPSVTVEDNMDKFLDDKYLEAQSWVANIRQSWPSTGCTIILDGWDDEITGRTMMNVLVDNPQGIVYLHTYDVSFPSADDKFPLMLAVIENVIQRVGHENVTQVISYTTSPLLKAVERRIEARYQSLYWNISATSCLAMMLQEIASLTWVRSTIDQAKTITRLVHNSTLLLGLLMSLVEKNEDCNLVKYAKVKEATPFLTLEYLLVRRKDLAIIFASPLWKNSFEGSSISGKKVARLVTNKLFWDKVSLVVAGGMPIVNVIKLINDENGPLMGLLYETMDQLKETIKEEIGDKEAMAFWTIIDNIWNNLLHSPLHAAGSYLNPSLFYVEDFGTDTEVTRGLMETIAKLSSPYTQEKITQQLKTYEQADKGFARGVAERDNLSPVEWWNQFGGDCPELQSFAIKVLGLCVNGASCYGFRRDVEKLNAMNGTVPALQKLLKERFVAYNSYLQELRQSKTKFDMEAPGISPNDDWVVRNN